MENSDNTTEKPKRKFKQTRELVKLALNHGWTQSEIAKTCRTQQSIVSAWSKGEKQGTKQQLQPLLELFGHKLRRNTFKLYQEIKDDKVHFVKVEGQVIFNLSICDKLTSGTKQKLKPKYKIVVHHQRNNQYIFIILIKNQSSIQDVNLENASWYIIYKGTFNANALINIFNESHANFNKNHELFGGAYREYFDGYPFLIRQALLNHGIEVQDVEVLPSLW